MPFARSHISLNILRVSRPHTPLFTANDRIRNRASVEYTGENGQNYALTFADFIQRNRETGNPSQVHRLVNGNDSTWYAKALRRADASGPNGERQFFVDRNTGRSTWVANRLCPARPLSGVAAVALQL